MAKLACVDGRLLFVVQKVSGIGIHNHLLLGVIAFLLLLNYGFMQIRFPLDIPISEMLLVFVLLGINHRRAIPRFLQVSFAVPVILWWTIGLVQIFFGIGKYGVWAIRDGSHIIESLFLYVGFVFARNENAVKWMFRGLPVFFGMVALYALTYPFRDSLIPLSPSISGSSGQQVSLFFMYTNTALILVAAAAYFLDAALADKRRKYYPLVAGGMITLSLVLFPSRTLILQLLAFCLFFAFRLRRTSIKPLLMAFTIPVVLMVIVSAFGISINGRFGTDFTPGDYLNLLMETIPGVSSNEKIISSGTEGRLIWWTGLLQQLTAQFQSFVFGLGYGMPLIDFGVSGGVMVREPHNDFISIFARGGITMLILFLVFQSLAIRQILKLIRHYFLHPVYSSPIVGLFFIMLGTLVTAIGEAPFIMAFLAVPYYFIMGFLSRLFMLRTQHE